MAATLAVWGPKINLTAHPQDPDEIVFHVFDSIIPISIAVSVEDSALGPGPIGFWISAAAPGFPGW